MMSPVFVLHILAIYRVLLSFYLLPSASPDKTHCIQNWVLRWRSTALWCAQGGVKGETHGQHQPA